MGGFCAWRDNQRPLGHVLPAVLLPLRALHTLGSWGSQRHPQAGRQRPYHSGVCSVLCGVAFSPGVSGGQGGHQPPPPTRRNLWYNMLGLGILILKGRRTALREARPGG